MDVMADLAGPLPVTVIAQLLGVPLADRERFKRWSDDLVGSSDAAAGGDSANLLSDKAWGVAGRSGCGRAGRAEGTERHGGYGKALAAQGDAQIRG